MPTCTAHDSTILGHTQGPAPAVSSRWHTPADGPDFFWDPLVLAHGDPETYHGCGGPLRSYWTVRIPYSAAHVGNPWTPDTPIGPFKVLMRGAFPTIGEAESWCREKLGRGGPGAVPHRIEFCPLDYREID